ncbi:hypothetical protein F5051DRAFT_445745 [Lentinula edodes]|nr:hypothetical protein F5051DRAFT_445745 [Lentinula edodes]
MVQPPPTSRVNLPNYQTIQALQNADLMAAAAKIDEEGDGDVNLIAWTQCQIRIVQSGSTADEQYMRTLP